MANTSTNPADQNQQVVEKLLTNQQEELRLRAQELELRKQADSNQFEYAKQSLAVQERLLNARDKNTLSLTKFRYGFVILILLFVLIFIGTALYLNKDQIVMEIIKAAIYIVTSGTGGYFYGRYSRKELKNVSDRQIVSSVS